MVTRITLTVDEASKALGISRDHFERHVMHDLRIVRSGRRRLVPVRELERWADQHATMI